MNGLIILWAFLGVVVFGFSVHTMVEDHKYPFPRSLAAAALLALLTPLVILALGMRTIIKLVKETW